MKIILKKFYENELQSIVLFIASIFVFYPLAIVGAVYNIFKSIYECFDKKRPFIGIINFFIYWLKIIYQAWCSVKFYIYQLAITNDYIGNAFGGELVEDCVTTEEKTLYGNGQVTVSASTGQLETNNKLNKFGVKFANLLSKVLGKDHCKNAYIKELGKVK